MQPAHSGPSQTSLLNALRQATNEAHRSLERKPAMARLLSTSLSRDQYAQALTVFAHFYHWVDRCFALYRDSSVLPSEYHYRPRLPALVKDLEQLIPQSKLAFSVSEPPWYSVLEQLSATQRSSYLLGLAYVVEGSAHGAKIIAPKIAKQLNLNQSNGLAFFQQQTASPDNWTVLAQFLGSVDGYASSEARQPRQYPAADLACQAATDAFQYLQYLSEGETMPMARLKENETGARTV